MGGVEELPRNILDYGEKHYPRFFESPTEWNGFEMQDYAEVFKDMVDSGEIKPSETR